MSIYNKNLFAFCEVLENNWLQIRDEYLSIEDQWVQWHEENLNPEKGWQVWPITDWPSGQLVLPYANKTPFTAKLLKDNVPGLGAGGFSRLQANKNIPAHKGLQANFLRCHLGLTVPDGDLGLKVEDQTIVWENGKCVVFDDRKLHQAWNFTDQDRIVLLVDFVPDI